MGVDMCKSIIQSPKFIEHFNYTCIHSFIQQMFIECSPCICIHTYVCIHTVYIYACVCTNVYIQGEQRRKEFYCRWSINCK